METLYPIFYGTRMVTFDVLRATFEPYMHPEAARRGFAFILSQGGLFGIGGGYRAPGTQPDKPGFALPGKSFHEGQPFPIAGRAYVAWDMVCKNPGGRHRSPQWHEVPKQGSDFAFEFGWHMNIETEPWHAQPVELDGWGAWDRVGKPDIRFDYPIAGEQPVPVPEPEPQPEPTPEPVPVPVPVPDPIPTPPSQEITVEFTSRNLSEGMSGNDIQFFQTILNDIAGQGLDLDGHYGPRTTQAVKNWQTVFGLGVDGQMGPRTQRSLIETALKT